MVDIVCYPNICRFNPANDGTVYAASSDGTISCTDLETGISLSLMNLNPNGWQVHYSKLSPDFLSVLVSLKS